MKRLLCLAVLALTAASAHAADVGVSVNVGIPGVFGRIDIGGYPQPQVLYPQPVYIQREPSRPAPQPIYLHVPPGHAKNWRKYCGQYGACGQPVYFVQDNWYRDVYTPRYQEVHRRGPDRRDERRDDRRDDRHDDRRDGRHDDRGDRHDGDGDRGRGRDNH